MLVQGRVGFDSTMALEMSMEWDWPGENLRRPQLDKFPVRRCDTDSQDLGTFNAGQDSLAAAQRTHAVSLSRTPSP